MLWFIHSFNQYCQTYYMCQAPGKIAVNKINKNPYPGQHYVLVISMYMYFHVYFKHFSIFTSLSDYFKWLCTTPSSS